MGPLARRPHQCKIDLDLDAIDAAPDPGQDELATFGGWGLDLVATLADRHGVHWPPPVGKAGKWVWATFMLRQ